MTKITSPGMGARDGNRHGIEVRTEVRAARTSDAAEVARIYNEGIRGRMATFETTERHASDICAWFDARYPFLVAEAAKNAEDGVDGEHRTVVGWIRASSYRARECYSGIGEFSVYVSEAARGQRVGDALMKAFVPACEAAGLWKLVSRIFPENTASRALCARNGFREVGTYERHAKLDAAWRDVVIVERLIPD